MRNRGRLHLLALAIGICVLTLSPLLAAAQGDLTLHINEVNSQNFPDIEVTVTVVDPYGIPISGLDASKFEASEEGVRVPLTGVEEFTNPQVTIAVMLVIDASGSMAGEPLEKAKQSAVHFIDSLSPADEAAVIAFGDSVPEWPQLDPTKEIDFTTDKNALKNLINGISTIVDVTTTPLYDAIFKAVEMTASRHPKGHRVVIVFTDGREGDDKGNKVSKLSAEAPIDRAEEGDIPVFTIGLGRRADENYLREVAIRTGGTYEYAPSADELSAIYQKIADQLRKQYRLKYVSKVEADGQKHKLTIKAITPQGEVDNATEFLARCPPGKPGIRLFYLKPSEVPGEEPEVEPLAEGQEVQDVLTVKPDISSCNPIDRVEYYLNGELRFIADVPPYHFIWDIKEERVKEATPYTLLVRAHDNVGNVGEKSIGLTVLPPPFPGPIPPWLIVLLSLSALLLLALLLYALRRRQRAREALAPAYVPPTAAAPPPGWEETTAPEVPSVPPTPEAITAYGETAPEMPRVGVPEVAPTPPTVVLSKEPPVMAHLVMEKGDRPGHIFRLQAGDTLIGRAGTCDIVLNDPTVSRQHAKVRLEGKDFYLHDLAATNPTRVNGREIGRHRLVDGDRIELGNTVLVFKQATS